MIRSKYQDEYQYSHTASIEILICPFLPFTHNSVIILVQFKRNGIINLLEIKIGATHKIIFFEDRFIKHRLLSDNKNILSEKNWHHDKRTISD